MKVFNANLGSSFRIPWTIAVKILFASIAKCLGSCQESYIYYMVMGVLP